MYSGGSLIFSLLSLFVVFFVIFLAWEVFWVTVAFFAERIAAGLKSFAVFLYHFSKELMRRS